MKHTTAAWTNIQNHLPDTPEGRRMWRYLESRTFGKVWSQDVAIAIKGKEHIAMIEDARKAIEPGVPGALEAQS